MSAPGGEVLLLTATVQPADVIYCERNDVRTRLADYLFAFRFWLGEPGVSRIVLVENSGFDLAPFRQLVAGHGGGKDVELLGFRQPPFAPGLGKSWGEAKIMAHALEHSRLLAPGTFVLKGTGRYYAPNFFRVWPHVRAAGFPFVLANFYSRPASCDSRYFGARVEFLRDYLLPACETVDDAAGRYFEMALADAVIAAERDGHECRPLPVGGFIVDGVQASTNTAFRYPRWKRLAYRGIAAWRNGVPFRWTLGAQER